jgi:hypothetical protein
MSSGARIVAEVFVGSPRQPIKKYQELELSPGKWFDF